ncbi:7-deoxyloganetin glucosyltransferase-like [Silene latifolia]|uniref:7-deoxyloganetin glucosyltransferase-like n=1 Tax=Silene latifolia TaxID=37657 RepID=UPI003D7841E1
MGSLQTSSNDEKPHAVCIPYPAQGHITPMLKLAKILHSKGFHITFVNTEYNRNRFLRSFGPNALDGLPSFRFEAIPDGLPPTEGDTTQDVPSLCESTERLGLGPFKELLTRLNEDPNVPRVSCIVSDVVMFFTVDAAEEFGVPEVMFWTASVCGLLGYAQYDKLAEMNIVPFKDENFHTNGDLDQVLDWIPSMENIRFRDMPSFIRTTNPDDFMFNYVRRLIHHSKRASAIVFNSYDAIEHGALEALSYDFPPLYNLGPIEFLLGPIQANNDETKSLTSSLWKEDPHCLEWLDSYDPNSVVYVNFGSVTVMTNDQLVEFAWGLANSHQPFLWITRPDLIFGDSAVLPPEFLEVVKGRGLIASWCNQEKVLGHLAVGGFLTHCGWNSLTESISQGVPVICWPFFAEQQTNCWYCCNKWGIGMEIDTNVKRDAVEKQVRELMTGEKGKEMKKKVMELKILAQEACASPYGSSYANIDNVIKVLQSPK